MDKKFPECAGLQKAYLACFSKQPFRWGTASGAEEDACEDAFDAFKECVENGLENRTFGWGSNGEKPPPAADGKR